MILVKDCAEVVSHILQVTVQDIYGERRQAYIAEARHYVYWLAKNYTKFSYPRIARAMKKDHSTVIHGVQKIDRQLANKDERTVVLCKQLQEELDRKFGDVDGKIIADCHENEIKELLPDLAMQLYTYAKQLKKDMQNEKPIAE